MRNILLVAMALMLVAGCGQGRKKTQAAGQQPEEQQAAGQRSDGGQAPGEQSAGGQTVVPKEFPKPDIPMYINEPEQRYEYLVSHYWDKFDFSDTLYVNSETLERAYGEYSSILMNYPDKETARRSIGEVMKKAEKYPVMYDYLWDMADKYLYDANSPVRDDEVYIGVLESVLANPSLDELMKIAPREKLSIVKMNRPGRKANDFAYVSSKGARGTLYGIKADYTMIFFYNLGCPACKQLRADMLKVLEEPLLAEYMGSGKLKILALYPDTQKEEWNKYLSDIPSDWINAYDPTTDNTVSRLYDLKAIPSLYLLDKDKNVILKDFTEPSKLYRQLIAEN